MRTLALVGADTEEGQRLSVYLSQAGFRLLLLGNSAEETAELDYKLCQSELHRFAVRASIEEGLTWLGSQEEKAEALLLLSLDQVERFLQSCPPAVNLVLLLLRGDSKEAYQDAQRRVAELARQQRSAGIRVNALLLPIHTDVASASPAPPKAADASQQDRPSERASLEPELSDAAQLTPGEAERNQGVLALLEPWMARTTGLTLCLDEGKWL